jgi:hypothetical protein
MADTQIDHCEPQIDSSDIDTPNLQPIVAPGVSFIQGLSPKEFNRTIKMIINRDPEIITKLLDDPTEIAATYEYLRAYVISGNSDEFKRMTNQNELNCDTYTTSFYR